MFIQTLERDIVIIFLMKDFCVVLPVGLVSLHDIRYQASHVVSAALACLLAGLSAALSS